MTAAATPEAEPIRLDREAFTHVLHLMALRLPNKDVHSLTKAFQGFLLDRPKMRSVVFDADSKDTRLLLLKEDIQDTGLSGLKADLRDLITRKNYHVVPHQVTLDYSHCSADQVLKRLLPSGMDIPGSFECVGHVAHLNLRDEMLPYKHVIGQVIVDKNPSIKTVVNKVGTVENEFRVFQMEVLAGEPSFETEVKQHGARFKLNFAEVYWNSRLEQEHSRLVKLFKPGQKIVDVMAGIGPFAIPAAQKGCLVLANDLNPRSHHYLVENIKTNKVTEGVQDFNMDGKAFIEFACRHAWTASAAGQPDAKQAAQDTAKAVGFDHAIMNLPASATSFLPAFRGACDESSWEGPLPMIHCYTFSPGAEDDAGVRSRTAEAFGEGLEGDAVQVHTVRQVAPNKRMCCVSFRLPAQAAFARSANGQKAGSDVESSKEELHRKRQCQGLNTGAH